MAVMNWDLSGGLEGTVRYVIALLVFIATQMVVLYIPIKPNPIYDSSPQKSKNVQLLPCCDVLIY